MKVPSPGDLVVLVCGSPQVDIVRLSHGDADVFGGDLGLVINEEFFWGDWLLVLFPPGPRWVQPHWVHVVEDPGE